MDNEDEPYCNVCGYELDRLECNECGGEGYAYHDCGEDVCCCADPEDNVPCEQCDGKGYWWYCSNAKNH